MAELPVSQVILLAVVFTVSLPISFLVTVPLVGTLVRFRANYNPKGLKLDAEGGVQPHTGPVVTSYFGMMGRVKRLEGWAGLYKGTMPAVLGTVVVMAFTSVVLGVSLFDAKGSNKYAVPAIGVVGMGLYALFMMIFTLPAMIVGNRAITTPHKLPWLKPVNSLRVLLTPTERRRPWVLYTTPGLLVAQIFSISYVIIIMQPLRRLLFPSLSYLGQIAGTGIPEDFTYTRFAIYVVVVVLSTAVLCPLEVISTRLSIQRNHDASGFSAVPQDEEPLNETNLEFAAPDEDVIGLRNEDDPYTGFVDCVKRIVDEEGYGTLYRAWWLAFVAVLLGSI